MSWGISTDQAVAPLNGSQYPTEKLLLWGLTESSVGIQYSDGAVNGYELR
jgi:hypothetical protein